MSEDAASVLEQFIQDVANLPAEIAHLLEEIQAKDRVIEECRNVITARDSSIQKFLKANGTAQANPKEEAYVKNIIVNYEKAQNVQLEKIALAERSTHLLDRQIRRLDIKIRDLQNEGAISIDPELPSLLKTSTLSTRLPPLSTSAAGGTSTALHPLSGNAGPANTTVPLTGNPSTRNVHPPRAHSNRHPSPSPLSITTVPSHIHPSVSGGSNNNLLTSTPMPSSLLNPRVATRSPSTDPAKRRRLNPHHLLIPPTSSISSSTFRQTSLGPGTPKSLLHHPLSNSRSGSAGPRPPKNKLLRTNQPPHHQRIGHLNPSSSSTSNNATTTSSKKPSRRRPGKKSTPLNNSTIINHPLKPTPSDGTTTTTAGGDDDSLLLLSDRDRDRDRDAGGADGGGGGGGGGDDSADVEMNDEDHDDDDEEDDGEGEGDDRKYCTCRSVSHGNMVACDNDRCPYEWFHWGCVGMTKEPVGTWFCDECRGKM